MPTRRDRAVPALSALSAVLSAVLLSGAVLVPAPAAAPPPEVRVSAGSSVPVDVAGTLWAADAHFLGGTATTSPRPVAGTAAPQLYATSRTGMTGYSVPVEPGGYTVTLSMAESVHRRPGRRVFDVLAEGALVLARVDVLREAGGPDRALERTFRATVTDGTLDITYRASRDRPVVSAVRVVPDPRTPAVAPTPAPSPTPSPSPTGSAPPPADPSAEVPVWADEFDGPAGALPDPARWGHEWGGLGWGDGELQEYTDRRPENASTDGEGHLRITARREELGNPWSGGARYTSARLSTASTYSFRYGRVEARAKLPSGQGVWPAFWLLGTDTATLGWPAGGELDVVETVNTPTTVFSHVHGSTTTGQHWSRGGGTPTVDLSQDFHVYAMDWRPDVVTFSVDGVTTTVVHREDLPPEAVWPFDRPHHMLLNVAVGGSWPGAPDSTTPFPATMLVDHVRVYR
ncbi:family 16 glycosylhydrolase [Aquipuribacter hungaricus]|uniref:Family 16 glycosylhydrolase n=1 Tax=Aquipuribacter hungaricus TaxID=545624 RepID=A0ABV7WHX1_9MICO